MIEDKTYVGNIVSVNGLSYRCRVAPGLKRPLPPPVPYWATPTPCQNPH